MPQPTPPLRHPHPELDGRAMVPAPFCHAHLVRLARRIQRLVFQGYRVIGRVKVADWRTWVNLFWKIKTAYDFIRIYSMLLCNFFWLSFWNGFFSMPPQMPERITYKYLTFLKSTERAQGDKYFSTKFVHPNARFEMSILTWGFAYGPNYYEKNVNWHECWIIVLPVL